MSQSFDDDDLFYPHIKLEVKEEPVELNEDDIEDGWIHREELDNFEFVKIEPFCEKENSDFDNSGGYVPDYLSDACDPLYIPGVDTAHVSYLQPVSPPTCGLRAGAWTDDGYFRQEPDLLPSEVIRRDHCYCAENAAKEVIDGSNLMPLDSNDGVSGVVQCKKLYKTVTEGQTKLVLFIAPKRKFKCPLCAVIFTNEYDLNRHLFSGKETRGQYYVRRCIHTEHAYCFRESGVVPKPERRNNKTSDIKRILNSQKACSCPQCFVECKNDKDLRLHLLSEHKENQKYRCYFCKVVYNFNCHLQEHMASSCAKLFRCESCPEIFSSSESIRKHKEKWCRGVTARAKRVSKKPAKRKEKEAEEVVVKNEEGKETDKKSLTCVACDRTLASSSSLQRHLALHPEGNCCRCVVCGIRFAERKLLEKHILTRHRSPQKNRRSPRKKTKTRR